MNTLEPYEPSDHFCGECKYCYEDETMFFDHRCSKNNDDVNFWQGACDDFEKKEGK